MNLALNLKQICHTTQRVELWKRVWLKLWTAPVQLMLLYNATMKYKNVLFDTITLKMFLFDTISLKHFFFWNGDRSMKLLYLHKKVFTLLYIKKDAHHGVKTRSF